MPRLDGYRVALLESRRAGDLANLVRRFGGTPVSAPSVREVRREDDFGPVLQRLTEGCFDVVVVLTAAACEALFAEAEKRQMHQGVADALAHSTVACRGPKPLLALKRREIVPDVVTEKPHTSSDLLDALERVEVSGRRVLLLHFGERSDEVFTALSGRGAVVENLLLYEWALPEDLEPLRAVVHQALDGRLDAMLFTSQVQFRHLLDVAALMGRDQDLVRTLRDRIIVGSIGPVCSRALRAAGIIPDVIPRSPNGPSLIQAFADYLSMFDPPEETNP
jgi:uroporphyrinogen-III synthase